MAERPHPRQISSNKVEHTATQGESLAVNTLAVAGAPGAGCGGAAIGVEGGLEGMLQG